MDFTAARDRMVASQIAARGISDPRVLDAMRRVERHRFVPPNLADDAYEDHPLPIGQGQTISQPYIVALMTEALKLESSHRVLEIGTGSGYQTAILAALAREVLTIERHEPLAATSRALFAELGLTNVTVIVADGTEGYAPDAPYDRIIVTAGARSVPAALKEQLADAGRLVIPVGPSGMQRLTTIERSGTTFTQSEGEWCTFVPLVGPHSA